MLEENERRIMELKSAIEEGERSGIAEDFNPKKRDTCKSVGSAVPRNDS